jgi:glycosyltransferase involved in cell wall biosynthesis
MKRILHVATNLGSGGLEKWLVDLAAAMDRTQFEHHILVQSNYLSIHGEKARQLGIPIIFVSSGQHLLRFAIGFYRALTSGMRYDVVHSHVHYFSGIVTLLARLAGVPVRVAHAHNDTSQQRASLARACYAWISRRLISAFATHGFGVTAACARDLFGRAFGSDPRWQVLPCGISLAPFRINWDRARVAAELGLAPERFVIVQIGRLTPMKNQEFSLEVLAALELSAATLLLLGEGNMEKRLRQQAQEFGVAERVVFAGARTDIPRVLCAIADLFILPSRHGEGASIAAAEAQAAGVPCLLSESIPDTAIIVRGLVERLSIEDGAAAWAAAIRRIRCAPKSVSRTESTRIVEDSEFSIESNCRILAAIYNS